VNVNPERHEAMASSGEEEGGTESRSATQRGRGRGRGRGKGRGGVALQGLVQMRSCDVDPAAASMAALYANTVSMVQYDWLTVPDEFMTPLKMPAVNQFVRCIPEIDFRFMSTGEEYVLVGTGNTMPDNFRKWIYCMHQVDLLRGLFTVVNLIWRDSRI